MTLILASGSEIRKTLLENAGLEIAVQVARLDEDMIKASMQEAMAYPRDIADKLAEAKSAKISNKFPDAIVLGCDQVLALKEKVFSKSDSADEAKEVLKQLRGETHRLYSAAVIYKSGKPVWRYVGVARLTMRKFSDDYLTEYLDRNWSTVSSSVGAYHLEGEGVRLFSKVEGDFFTVLGLPLVELLSYLTLIGEIDG